MNPDVIRIATVGSLVSRTAFNQQAANLQERATYFLLLGRQMNSRFC
jgi:hypothetical protein